MENNNIKVIPLYTDEELVAQRVGARLLIMKLLAEIRADWNSMGVRLFLEREIQELEE